MSGVERLVVRTEDVEVPEGSAADFAGEVHYPNGQSALVEIFTSSDKETGGLVFEARGLPDHLSGDTLTVSQQTLASAEHNKSLSIASMPIQKYVIGALAGFVRTNQADSIHPSAEN